MLISEKILSHIKPDNYFKYPFNQYMKLNHQIKFPKAKSTSWQN
ncbi:MAG: hypothetical protein QS2022_5660 [Candidatus Phytoplasma asteris]|nr:hypothetical protein ['Chrysanthemum coronarium' phytoplasma]TKA87784.1 MAG: hypothetical protein PLY_5640 [Periwinkle leaf yellowing phytoplasma]WEX19806.1 MAG: hypothetical protein QS2022_5660 [Candidatus Phytoplasma asteris]